MKMLFLLGGMLLAWTAAQATDLYRWKDKDGVVHYGDKPREDADKVRIGDRPPAAASGVDDATLPFDVRTAHKNFPVTLYVTESCTNMCDQARDFLKKRRVPFSEVILKTEEDFAGFKQKAGTDSVPTVSIGRTWMKGFQSDDWRNELEAVGYPK